MTKDWSGSEQEYYRLRQNLNSFEYSEHFGSDSFSLVSRIFSDLVKTTQSSKLLKERNNELENEVSLQNSQLAPLKDKVMAQGEEMNDLHLELIKAKDEIELLKRTWMKEQRKQQKETDDLRFMNTYLKNRQPQQNQLDIEPDKFLSKMQKIDLKQGLELEPMQQQNFTQFNPITFDLLKLTEISFHKTKQELSQSRLIIKSNEFDLETIGTKLLQRQEYIQKLSSCLKLTPLDKKMDLKQALERINSLEQQLSELNEHHQILELEVEEIEDKKMFIQSGFVKQLQETDQKLLLEQEKQKKMAIELDKLNKMLDQVQGQQRGGLKVQKRVKELEEFLQNAEEGRVRDQKRLVMMTKDVQKLKNENKSLKAGLGSKKEKENNAGLDLKKKGESDLKKETKDASDLFTNPLGPNTTNINANKTAASTANNTGLFIAEQTIIKLNQKISSHERTQKDLLSQLQTLTLKTESTSHLLTDLKISKTNMQKEINRLGDDNERLLEALEFFEQELKGLNEQLKGVCMDRDAVKELYRQVNEEVVCLRAAAIGNVNENTSANVNVNASANVNGNANLRGKLEDISANNKSQNDSKSNSHASDPPAGQKQNLVLQKEQGEKIESLEKIIKDYKEKLGKSTKEIDSLKEDMKEIMTRQRDSGTIATTAIIQIDKELSDLKQELDAKTLSNKKLELDIKQLQMEVIKLEKSEEELLDENMKLKRKREEFDNYKTNNNLEIRELRSQLKESEKLLKKQQKELSVMKSNLDDKERLSGDQKGIITKFDKERDQMISELDDKTEKIAMLKDLKEYETQQDESRKQISELTKSLNLRDQELFELEENVDYYSKTLKQCDGYKNELLEENEKIMNDLKVLGRENQIMNLEFQKLSTENQTMQTYEKESQEDLERLHIIIADQKEQIYDIQLKYRGLILEFENTKQQARQGLSMLDEEKLKSVSKTKIMESLYSQIDIFQQDLETRNLEFLRVEKEITNLTRVLHTLEKQSKLITSENETLKKALYDQRDILQIGNHEYKDVQNQKYKLQIENESLKKEFREFQIEIQRLENCCEDERLKVDKLNNVLNVERQKSFESQIKLEEVMKSKSFVELKLRGVQNDDQNELEKMKLENQRLGVLVGSLRVEDPQLRVEDEIERELKDTRDRKISLQASDLSNKSVSRSNSEHGSNDAHVGSVASMDTMGNQDLFADRKGVFDDRLLETIINSKNETPK